MAHEEVRGDNLQDRPRKEGRPEAGNSFLHLHKKLEFTHLYFQPNHLLGYRRLYLQLLYRNISDLLTVRKDLLPLAQENSAKMNAVDAYAEVVNASAQMQVSIDGEEAWGAEVDSVSGKKGKTTDPRDMILDIREYDVPYHLRVAIDLGQSLSTHANMQRLI
jgi:hypothetical protein